MHYGSINAINIWSFQVHINIFSQYNIADMKICIIFNSRNLKLGALLAYNDLSSISN